MSALLAVGALNADNLRPAFSQASQEIDDEAHVTADVSHISAQVSGQVSQMLAKNYTYVTKGQPLVQLERDRYIARKRKAVAKYDAAIARLNNLQNQEAVQRAEIIRCEQRSAHVKSGAIIPGYYNQGEPAEATEFAIRDAEASLQAARAQLEVIRGTEASLSAAIDEAKAVLSLAEQDEAQTIIRAPFDGFIQTSRVHIGDFVELGQPVMDLVPQTALYVSAHLGRRCVEEMSIAEQVTMRTTSFPEIKFEGNVAGITISDEVSGPVTYLRRSISGKFSVRIDINGNQPISKLQPGMPTSIDIVTPSGKIECGS
jgi:membrane fusion protein (multidrug efflux system)